MSKFSLNKFKIAPEASLLGDVDDLPALAPWRRTVGVSAALAATASAGWLVLAVFDALPAPEVDLLRQSGIRLLAEATVVSLLVAAIAFWES